MGIIAFIIIGLIAGLIGSLFRRDGQLFDLHPTGILMSVVGAVVVLLLVGAAGRRRVHA